MGGFIIATTFDIVFILKKKTYCSNKSSLKKRWGNENIVGPLCASHDNNGTSKGLS
jgi:hypothetical protein